MIGISEHMTFKDGKTLIHMKLRGIMYFGNFHFTSCIIDSNENVWFLDGMVTGQTSSNEGKLHEYTTESMKTCKGENAAVVIYAHE